MKEIQEKFKLCTTPKDQKMSFVKHKNASQKEDDFVKLWRVSISLSHTHTHPNSNKRQKLFFWFFFLCPVCSFE